MATSDLKSRLIRPAIILSWCILIGWLVVYEAFPERFSGTVAGYQSLIPKNMLVNETWMSISINGTKSGYTRNVWNIDDTNKDRYYINDSQTYIDLKTGPLNLTVSTDSSYSLDQKYNLTAFEFRIRLDNSEIFLKGQATDKTAGEFDVTLSTTGTVRAFSIKVPHDTILFSPMGSVITRKMKPGQSITINSMDPFTMRKNPIVISALRKEDITVGKASVSTTVISTKTAGLTFLSWIDQTGDIVRNTSPFGIVMERTTMDDTMAWLKDNSPGKRGGKPAGGAPPLIDEAMIRQLLDTFMKGTPQ